MGATDPAKKRMLINVMSAGADLSRPLMFNCFSSLHIEIEKTVTLHRSKTPLKYPAFRGWDELVPGEPTA